MNGKGPPSKDQAVRAVVSSVLGDKGYVVAYPCPDDKFSPIPQDQSVTFGTGSWKGSDPPDKGQEIYMKGVYKYRRGWRAREAYPIEPCSEPKSKKPY